MKCLQTLFVSAYACNTLLPGRIRSHQGKRRHLAVPRQRCEDIRAPHDADVRGDLQ